MDVFKSQNVPCLALVLGDEVALTSLQQSFTAFPHGVTYPQFRHILQPYLPASTLQASAAAAASDKHVSSPTHALSPVSAKTPGLRGLPTFSRVNTSFVVAEVEAAAPTQHAERTTDIATTTPPGLLPLTGSTSQQEQDANREEARMRRVRTRQELAGLSATPVDPIKQLFNRIDVGNDQRVTWENLLDYVVAEAGDGVAEVRYNANRTQIYSFSRALRCPTKQQHHQPPQQTSPQQLQQERQPSQLSQSGSRTVKETLTYKRFHRDIQEAQAAAARAKSLSTTAHGSSTGSPGNATGSSSPIHVEDDLSLIRVVDGLEGHNGVFFVSSRSHPFLLYSKDTLERVFTAPPGMLGEAAPNAVAYLAELDFFLAYSTDDRLLRGWYALLAQSIATVAVTPLLVEGFVRRMRVMPPSSPTYGDYADSVFLGDSYGHVLHVTAPRGRAGGMEFALQRTYRSLHSRASGGLVDFCVYGSTLFSSGFDGRVVATSLSSGQSSEIGTVAHEHLHALVYVPPHNGLVAATSSTRQLLWWEAGAQSALPGVPFQHAGYGDHAAAIIAVVYVADADYLASADCDGVVKIWEMVTHRCVQSLHSSRMSTTSAAVPGSSGGSGGGAADEGGSGGGGSNSEDPTPRATLKSQGRARQVSAATKSTNFTASAAGRDMMMLTHNGLHSLLSESAGTNHMGGVACHSLCYCAETEELMCGFANAITCWGLHGHKNPYMCDANEVCQDVLYDVRTQSFLLRSATRLSIWDGVHGVRRGLLDRTKLKNTTRAKSDIKSVCLDDLGSRVFLSASDGNVYVYATQSLTADAATEMHEEESLRVWSAASAGPTTAQGATTNTTPVNVLEPGQLTADELTQSSAPVQVEQMYFFSTLRTWVAITSAGTLLVRTEADSHQTAFAATVNVSVAPLRLLRVSEELGLVAVVDALQTVFLYDMEAWTDAPTESSLALYGRIVDLSFLDSAPVLVTVHAGGVCRCWSCPPAVECFELLSTIPHPQLPSSLMESAQISTKGGVENVAQRLSSGAAASRSPATTPSAQTPLPAKLSVSLSLGGEPTSGAATTRPTSAAAPTIASVVTTSAAARPTSGRPLTATLRSKAVFSMSGTSKTHRATGNTTHQLGGTLRDRPKNVGKDSSGGEKSQNVDSAGTLRGRSVSPGSFIMKPEERAKALLDEVAEFTSVAYDGRSHHLFLGDTQGVVHIYRMCELLRHFQLPRCAYASRPAFSLFSHDRVHRGAAATVLENDAGSCTTDDDERSSEDAAAEQSASPVLLRSVDVHVSSHRDRPTGRKRSLSVAATSRLPLHQQLHYLQQQQQQSSSSSSRTTSHRRDNSGVICVRWLASRGVLATSGNDHEVWLLNAEGDKLGFLSAERLPPRPKKTLHTTTPQLQVNRPPLLESLAASFLSEKAGNFEDALPLQRPFCLPPAQPDVEEVSEMVSTLAQSASPLACCTHPRFHSDGGTHNHHSYHHKNDDSNRHSRALNYSSKTMLIQNGGKNGASSEAGTAVSQRVPSAGRCSDKPLPSSSAALHPTPPAIPAAPGSEAPASTRTARALVEYLTSANTKASTQRDKREKGEGGPSSPVDSVREAAFSGRSSNGGSGGGAQRFAGPACTPASPAARPIPIAHSHERPERSPTRLRFTRAGRAVQASPPSLADVADTRLSSGGKASRRASPTASRSIAAVAAAAAAAAAAAPLPSATAAAAADKNCTEQDTDLQLSQSDHGDGLALDTSCSTFSNHTGKSTLPNVATPLSLAHAPSMPECASFWQTHKIGYTAEPSALLQPDVSASAQDTSSLWITGVPLGQLSSAQPHAMETARLAAGLPRQPDRHALEFSARLPTRHGGFAPSSPLRPKTTGGIGGTFHPGRLGRPAGDHLVPSLSATYNGNGMPPSRAGARPSPQAQRAATASTSRMNGGSAKASPMLAYASAAEGSETLELYSRELRQRLRRPRRADS